MGDALGVQDLGDESVPLLDDLGGPLVERPHLSVFRGLRPREGEGQEKQDRHQARQKVAQLHESPYFLAALPQKANPGQRLPGVLIR